MIPTKAACNIMIVLLIAVLLFHFAVVLEFINYQNTWGGRLNNKHEMYIFEIVSISINLFLLFIVLQKANYFKRVISLRAINIVLWVFVFLFALNTIGNLFANNIAEKTVGTFFTLLSCYLCWAMIKKNAEKTAV